MHTSNKEDRRGQFIIDPQMPVRALKVAGFHLLAVAVCIGIPLFAMMRSMDVFLQGQTPRMVVLFERWQTYLVIALGVYVLVATAAWLLASLWRTHRTAGPIIRFTRFAHELAAGNFSARIHLRERDELQALAAALNGLADGLESRDQALLNEITERVEQLSQPRQVESAPPSDTPDDVVALVDSAFETAAPGSPGQWTPNPN